ATQYITPYWHTPVPVRCWLWRSWAPARAVLCPDWAVRAGCPAIGRAGVLTSAVREP
ncbi:hypothetical protein GBAR_LOCUS13215, partial [Geodia barretti]